MADASFSTQSSDASGIAAILSLLVQAMKGQQAPITGSPATTGTNYTGPKNNEFNTIPGADASDESLQNWYLANQGRTVYDSKGNPGKIPTMGYPASQGGQYDEAAPNAYGSGVGTPEPGTIRGWINNKGGILNGASFDNPLIAQAEQMLQKFQSSSPQTSELTPPAQAPAPTPTPPAAPTYTPMPASNPFASGLPATPQPAASPMALPSTTVPANNPAEVTNMIGANANQAASNPNLTAAIGQLANSGSSPSGSGVSPSMSYLQPILRKYNSTSSTPQMSMANAQTPVGGTMDLGSVDSSAPMGLGGANYAQGGLDAMSGINAAPLSSGGANYAAGGLDSGAASSGFGAGGGAASLGGAMGGMGMGQAAGIGSSVGALITSLGKMFTPGVPGIPSLPSGVPLSQFRPAVMT